MVLLSEVSTTFLQSSFGGRLDGGWPNGGRADRRESSRPSAVGTSAHTAYTRLCAAEAAEA